MALRCTRCALALPEGTDRCPKCLRTSTVVDTAARRARTPDLARGDELADADAPTTRRWWMLALIVFAQAGLGLAIHLAKQAKDSGFPGSHPENDVIRWVIVPYFLALTYATKSVVADWLTAGAAIFVALLGPIMLEVAAVVVAYKVIDQPTETTLVGAVALGLLASLALAAAWAFFTLRAEDRRMRELG